MNIIELAEQAGIEYSSQWMYWTAYEQELEHFARLIRQDEAQACAKHYVDIMRDAVEQAVLREREACAKLIEDIEIRKTTYSGWLLKVKKEYADAIRARGEK